MTSKFYTKKISLKNFSVIFECQSIRVKITSLGPASIIRVMLCSLFPSVKTLPAYRWLRRPVTSRHGVSHAASRSRSDLFADEKKRKGRRKGNNEGKVEREIEKEREGRKEGRPTWKTGFGQTYWLHETAQN